MYRKCVTEISVQHQKQFEAALLALMQKVPYEQITVTQLCQEAGIARRIFYHLFGSKQDALHALLDHTILGMESFQPEMQDLLRFLLYWKENKALLDALRSNQMSGLLLERMIGSILREDYDVWRWLQAEDLRNRQDILVFNISGIMGLIFSWYYSDFQKSPEQMAALMENLMRNPLAKHSP